MKNGFITAIVAGSHGAFDYIIKKDFLNYKGAVKYLSLQKGQISFAHNNFDFIRSRQDNIVLYFDLAVLSSDDTLNATNCLKKLEEKNILKQNDIVCVKKRPHAKSDLSLNSPERIFMREFPGALLSDNPLSYGERLSQYNIGSLKSRKSMAEKAMAKSTAPVPASTASASSKEVDPFSLGALDFIDYVFKQNQSTNPPLNISKQELFNVAKDFNNITELDELLYLNSTNVNAIIKTAAYSSRKKAAISLNPEKYLEDAVDTISLAIKYMVEAAKLKLGGGGAEEKRKTIKDFPATQLVLNKIEKGKKS